jgi:hypothetical protein
MTDWLDRNALLAILPGRIVDQILLSTDHYGLSGDPIIPADELNDRIALAQLDFDIREDNK